MRPQIEKVENSPSPNLGSPRFSKFSGDLSSHETASAYLMKSESTQE